MDSELRHLVIGAGPAGLTAAWQLARQGHPSTILEADPEYVGGISRTVRYRGFRFDIGGHRFYTKSAVIQQLWEEMLPDEFIDVPRLSRIYYDRHFFPYPIRIGATLKGLGLRRSFAILGSSMWARLRPRRNERSFEDWMVNRFGRRLYDIFFKTYTEKVWGLPCTEISKDFAAQRIRNLSFTRAVKDALFPQRDGKVSTLIRSFRYPRHGPGQLWEAVRDQVIEAGAELHHGQEVVKVRHADGRVREVEVADGTVYAADEFFTTMPLRNLILALDPPAPEPVIEAAKGLRYRDFLTVALIYDRPDLFPDNWIYIHDPEVKVGRIQNYGNWSADMVPEPGRSCLGLEYFVNEGDEVWSMADEDLLRLGAEEVEKIGLAAAKDTHDGAVVRERKAYPVYDESYAENRRILKDYLNGAFANLHPAGRGALHSYNSQDHSMMAALCAVRNSVEGLELDVWAINTEEEYAEEGAGEKTFEERLVPRPLHPESAAR